MTPIETCYDNGPFLLPRCYQTIPNHADPSRTTSVPSVEIFEFYSVLVLGGNAPLRAPPREHALCDGRCTVSSRRYASQRPPGVSNRTPLRLKSIDGGTTWSRTGLADIYVGAVAIDPATPTEGRP